MKVIILGGAGFIGSHVADELSKKGHKVTIFDTKKSKWLNKDQKMVVGDIFNYRALKNAIKNNQIVYNFAALSDLDRAMHEPLVSARINILGTVQALNLCKKYKVKRFIHASSIYATSSQGGFYSCSKRAADDYVEEFNKIYNLNYTILRFGSVYGDRSDQSNGLHKIIDQAIMRKKIIYQGNKKTVRKYINVLDAAKACVEILKNKYKNKCVILTGKKITKINELLKFIASNLKINSKIMFYDDKVNNGHYIETPKPYKAKIGRKLLFKSKVNFYPNLSNLIKDIKKNYNRTKYLNRISKSIKIKKT
jgi:UDP-glucose 4-epimerase